MNNERNDAIMTKTNRNLIFSGIFLCFSLFMAGCTADLQQNSVSSQSKIHATVDWTSHYNQTSDMVNHADLIVVGKVVDSYTEQRSDMIFTKQVIQATEVYQGEIQTGDRFELLQTGGEMNGIHTPEIAEIPLMKQGQKYLLMLQKTEDGYYLILGGSAL